MAIAIKSIPTLKSREARSFIDKANASSEKRATVNFSQQVKTAQAIIEKARMY